MSSALPYHPVANLFPLLEGEELEQFRIDIKLNGLLKPILLVKAEGTDYILDGRNRYRACLIEGVEPRFEYWTGTGSLVQYVMSLNLHRRHLDTSQRAMLAARAIDLMEDEARAAQLRNLKRGNAQPEKPETPARGTSAGRAAKMTKVSETIVKDAQRVRKKGTPELVEAVDAGKVKVTWAARVAGKSRDEQLKAIDEQVNKAKVANSQVAEKQSIARGLKALAKAHRAFTLTGPQAAGVLKLIDKATELARTLL